MLGASWAERHRDAMKGFALMESPLSPDASNFFPEQMKAGMKMLKTEKGEQMVLQMNMMIESAIPSGIMRTLSEQEHSEYRRPFIEPGESRRPLYSFVSSIPMDCEPADVYSMQHQTFSWIQTAEMPILFIRGDPGSSVTKEEADVVRQF